MYAIFYLCRNRHNCNWNGFCCTSIDKVAEYGIGGLIVGGILAKTGMLAKIGIFLVKGWKIIAIAVVGLIAAFKNKIFRKKVE